MKKILASLMGVLLLVFMFGTTVSAAQLSSEDIVKIVNETNYTIEQDIIRAQAQANVLTKKYDAITSKLDTTQKVLSIKNYDGELDGIINRLIQRTNDIANNTIRIAAENGYTVICEKIEVQVGDRVILIDPLRVADT